MRVGEVGTSGHVGYDENGDLSGSVSGHAGALGERGSFEVGGTYHQDGTVDAYGNVSGHAGTEGGLYGAGVDGTVGVSGTYHPDGSIDAGVNGSASAHVDAPGGFGGSAEVRASAAVHRSAVGLAKAARGMLAQFDSHVIESLDQIRVPTLLIIGANDTPFLNGMDYMAKKIPGSEHVIIPDAGHASNIDQPQVFNETMLRFLDRVTQ